MELISRVMNDGSTTLLADIYGILIREEQTHNSHTITVRKGHTREPSLQTGCLNDYWSTAILDKAQPIKWSLKEFYVDVEIRLQLNIHFVAWTFAYDEHGTIKKLVIESKHHPSLNIVEGYDLWIELKKNYLYEYRLYDIGKMIFTL